MRNFIDKIKLLFHIVILFVREIFSTNHKYIGIHAYGCYYCIRLFYLVSKYPLFIPIIIYFLSLLGQNSMSFCGLAEDLEDMGIRDINANRTCYEVMNEPLPGKHGMLVVHGNGIYTLYKVDGSITNYFMPTEITVVEVPRYYSKITAWEEPSTSFSSSLENPDTSKEEKMSNIISEPVPLHLRHPNDILVDYYNKICHTSDTREIVSLSLAYVENIFPENYWSSSLSDLNNDKHPLNVYVIEFSKTIEIADDNELAFGIFSQFNAAILTNNLTHMEPSLSEDMKEKIFDDFTIKAYTAGRK